MTSPTPRSFAVEQKGWRQTDGGQGPRPSQGWPVRLAPPIREDSETGHALLQGAPRELQSASECKPANATFCTEAVLTSKFVHVSQEM